MKKIFLILLLSMLVISCGKKESTDTGTKDKSGSDNEQKSDVSKSNNSTQPVNPENVAPSTQPQLNETYQGKTEFKWEFVPLKRGKNDEPMTDVNLVVNGKKHFVTKIYYDFSEVEKSQFTDYQIPSNALSACRGWWAGAGIDYWIIKTDNELTVFGRDIGETIG